MCYSTFANGSSLELYGNDDLGSTWRANIRANRDNTAPIKKGAPGK